MTAPDTAYYGVGVYRCVPDPRFYSALNDSSYGDLRRFFCSPPMRSGSKIRFGIEKAMCGSCCPTGYGEAKFLRMNRYGEAKFRWVREYGKAMFFRMNGMI